MILVQFFPCLFAFFFRQSIGKNVPINQTEKGNTIFNLNSEQDLIE